MTPQGKIAPGLMELLRRMHELADQVSNVVLGCSSGFNAMISPAGVDVSHLRLVDNGEDYECVCKTPENAPFYDIWEKGQLLYPNLDKEQAAHFMLRAYYVAKLNRVKP